MRKLTGAEHGLSVLVGGTRKSGIQSEWKNSSLPTRLVGQGKKLLLSLKLVVDKRNVGSGGGNGMKLAFLRRSGDGRAGCGGCHQLRYRLEACGAYAE